MERDNKGAREGEKDMSMKKNVFAVLCVIWLLIPSHLRADDLCRVDLRSLSKTSGAPGDTFAMYGVWGETQGSKTPSINKGVRHSLEVLSWTDSAITVRIPPDLPGGLYKVGVYCNNPPHWQGSGWMDFTVHGGGRAGIGNAQKQGLPAARQAADSPPPIPAARSEAATDSPSPRGERILSFRSDITVRQDSTMTVRETITVRAEGNKIKRGIYRDFPTTYRDNRGNRYTVGFSVESVLRDGRPEPHHEESVSNGKRVYIGEKNTYLGRGVYVYTLAYRTDRQLGFFPDHDELYWNVTGNGWDFPIDEASASVALPGGAGGKGLSLEGYTGPQGAKGRDYSAGVDGSGIARFEATRPLGPREGLTIVVSWPKGFIHEPGMKEKADWFLRDNPGRVLAVFGLIAILIYYLVVWTMAGKDPDAGTVVVRYAPPSGMSPAVMRYITKMGYDDRTLASAVIDMAVKGRITIREDDGTFTLKMKEGEGEPLSPEEEQVRKDLLGSEREITLKNIHHEKISAAIKALRDSLAQKYEKIYFITNRGYFCAGMSLTVVMLVLSGIFEASSGGKVPVFLFICVWLSIWSVAVAALVSQIFVKWRHAIRNRGSRVLDAGGALFLTLFALPFIAGEIFGISILGYATSVTTIIFLLLAGLTNYTFYHLLKAPTRAGRRLLDAIDGFRLFLNATEKDRLNMFNPPHRTPELFERFLPYALALGVEQRWSEQFSDVLASSGKEDTYSPAWFSGTSLLGMTSGDFVSSLGDSFSGAISSSSAAPGSSSGGGGGGSSGGGGGGGGGW